jgi:hypothetical protein
LSIVTVTYELGTVSPGCLSTRPYQQRPLINKTSSTETTYQQGLMVGKGREGIRCLCVLNLEEIEASHTLGGYRRFRCYSTVRYTTVNRSRRICCRKGNDLVVKKNHGPCESEDHEHRVGDGANTTLLSDTL